MVINDGVDKKVLQNILIGEVWICSGQSNMEFPIRGDWARLMDADQIVASRHHPALRLMQIKNTTSLAPLDDAAVEYGWIESSPSAASFSAIGYLYGTMLQDSLNIPIGIIDATWGGTDIEAWTPQKSLRNVSEIKNINRLGSKVAFRKMNYGITYSKSFMMNMMHLRRLNILLIGRFFIRKFHGRA